MSKHKITTAIRGLGQKLFGQHLFLTNCVLCGTLMGAGDVTAQFIEKRSLKLTELDKQRSGRYTFFGLCLGPLNHVWYTFLDAKFPLKTSQSIFKKIVLDQTIAGPVVLLALFFGLGFLEKRSFKQTTEDCRSNFLTIYKCDLCTWPLAQVINFYWIPAPYRVLYVSGVTYGWNTFLAFYKNNYVNKGERLFPSDVTFFGSEGAKHFHLLHFEDLPEEDMIAITERTKSIMKKMKI